MKKSLWIWEWIALLFVISFGASAHPVLLLISALLHESAHIITGILCGAKQGKAKAAGSGITLFYYPGSMPYAYEVIMICSGCAASLFCAWIGYVSGYFDFAKVNLALFLVNMIPAKGLDGGELLFTVCEWIGSPLAYRAAKTIFLVSAFLFWLVTVYYELKIGENMTLLVIAVYLLVRSAE